MKKGKRINLLTDAPKHNLALMKISAWHKAQGHSVMLNMPLFPADLTYASKLFDWSTFNGKVDIAGGPAVGGTLPLEAERLRPDYDLYGLDFSLGYTYRYCPRNCSFCKVPSMEKDKTHYSIWDFHDSRFRKICLLNNNTFADPKWEETFQEIWDADLTVIDENGYDLRLMNADMALALKRTRFQGSIHFAWDRMKDEKKIMGGLRLLKLFAIRGQRVYVLIGYDTTREEDLYRCQKIIDYHQDPYIMPYQSKPEDRGFKRFIDSFMWRKYKTIEQAWLDYER